MKIILIISLICALLASSCYMDVAGTDDNDCTTFDFACKTLTHILHNCTSTGRDTVFVKTGTHIMHSTFHTVRDLIFTGEGEGSSLFANLKVEGSFRLHNMAFSGSQINDFSVVPTDDVRYYNARLNNMYVSFNNIHNLFMDNCRTNNFTLNVNQSNDMEVNDNQFTKSSLNFDYANRASIRSNRFRNSISSIFQNMRNVLFNINIFDNSGDVTFNKIGHFYSAGLIFESNSRNMRLDNVGSAIISAFTFIDSLTNNYGISMLNSNVEIGASLFINVRRDNFVCTNSSLTLSHTAFTSHVGHSAVKCSGCTYREIRGVVYEDVAHGTCV